jgi:glycine/D-amino acid oxidase-like deaminating enzyme
MGGWLSTHMGPQRMENRQAVKRAVVLGAGIQGVCAALVLARQGYRVTLVDRARRALDGASLRNEGKIHLGFVYANDPSMRTSYLMLETALQFAGLVEGFVGHAIDWAALKSRPFVYYVAHDSLVERAQVREHYERMQAHYLDVIAQDRAQAYLGERPDRLFSYDLPEAAKAVRAGYAEPLAATAEVAVELPAFCGLLRAAAGAHERIACRFGIEVEAVLPAAGGGWTAVGMARSDRAAWHAAGDIVVNCLWDGRLKVDRSVGLVPDRPWVHRLKYRLLGRLPERLRGLPSMTFVLGPYGDVVTYPSGQAYLSSYASCVTGCSSALAPPAVWQAPCRGEAPAEEAAAVECDVLAALDAILPGIGETQVEAVDAGMIFSWGDGSLADPLSEVHRRCDTGIHCKQGYFSIDTGKFTNAPYYAERLRRLL